MMSSGAGRPDDAADGRQIEKRMDAISGALARILKRLDTMDERLTRLESPSGVAPSLPREPVEQAPAPESLPMPEAIPMPEPIPPPVHVEAPQVMETRMGLTWVNRIGVVTLLLGAAFGFKYAVDNEWIGPAGRVALGVLAGLAALVAGERLWKREQKIFAQGITGLGLALVYLSFYASFGFYKLAPQTAAFVLMVTATAAAGALSIRYNSLAVAILGLLGGYSTPVLLSTGQDAPWTLFSYVALLNLGSAWISRRQTWPALAWFSFVATAILFAGWHDKHYTPEKAFVATLFVFVFYLQFAMSRWPLLFASAQVACAYVLTETVRGPLQNVLGAELALLVLGLGFAAWLDFSPGLAVTVGAWWLSYAVPQFGAVEIGRLPAFTALTAQVVIALAWLVWRNRARLAGPRDLAVSGANAAAYYAASYSLLRTVHEGWLGLLAVAVAALHLAAAWRFRKQITERLESETPYLFEAALALGFLTLAVPVQLSGFSITMAWAVEMAALAWLAARVKEERFVWAVWSLGVLVFVRLWFFDVDILKAGEALFLNGRFFAFLSAAAAYALASWWLKPRRGALVFYILSNIMMLSALIMEALDWARRAAAPENRLSAETLCASAVMGLYALLLVAAGVTSRTVINRILGLILFSLVIVKLYLVDIWQLRLTFRIVAFLGLGGILILASYFYSHFRARIESFWADDEKPAS